LYFRAGKEKPLNSTCDNCDEENEGKSGCEDDEGDAAGEAGVGIEKQKLRGESKFISICTYALKAQFQIPVIFDFL